MADETKSFTTTFDDPSKSHDELESHRGKAMAHFDGHVHIVRTNTTSVPMHNDAGDDTGHRYIMTSVWKKAPEEPQAPAAE